MVLSASISFTFRVHFPLGRQTINVSIIQHFLGHQLKVYLCVEALLILEVWKT